MTGKPKLQRAEALDIDDVFLMDRSDLAGDVQRLKDRSAGGFDVVMSDYAAALRALQTDETVRKIVIGT